MGYFGISEVEFWKCGCVIAVTNFPENFKNLRLGTQVEIRYLWWELVNKKRRDEK